MPYWLRLSAFIAISFALQLLLWYSLAPDPRFKKDAKVIVSVNVKRPPPPPPKPLPPPPLEVPKPRPKTPAVDLQKMPVTPPPPAPEAPPQTAPPKRVPISFGLSLSSFAQGPGGVPMAAPLGNTLRTEPTNRVAPDKVKPLAPEPMPAARVTKLPEKRGECEVPYPKEAIQAGLEGLVVLSLDIDVQGNVVSVRLVQGLSPPLDAAALAGIKRCRFLPAKDGDTAVAVKNLIYKYRFVLE